MAKISAETFSKCGDKFLGQSYSKMDCQKFVENAMREAGLNMDLAGSNTWLREVNKNGWIGSPEECKAKFGHVPTGALLFIRAFDGGEPAKYQGDGLGNASHIGIVTHRSGAAMVQHAQEEGICVGNEVNFGDGAIHSSGSRGMVCTSKFADKTISGGGWNIIGLYKKFSYGAAIDAILDGGSGPEPEPEPIDPDDPGEGDTPMTGVVWSENGNPVNFRVGPSTKQKLVGKVPCGNEIEILEIVNKNGVEWVHGTAEDEEGRRRTGYMMSEFVSVDDRYDDGDIPDEPFEPGEDPDNESVTITLSLTVEEAVEVLPVLEKLVDAIVSKVGRG